MKLKGIYFTGKTHQDNARKIDFSIKSSSVVFDTDDFGNISDIDDDLDNFEKSLQKAQFNTVMAQLLNIDVASVLKPFGDLPTHDDHPPVKPDRLHPDDLSFCDSLLGEMDEYQEAVQKQYFEQVVKEIKSWSYDPECELDEGGGGRARTHSEGTEHVPPIQGSSCFERSGTYCGSEPEFCSPRRRDEGAGGTGGMETSSPFQKSSSLSIILKSPDISRFRSRLRPCRNPNCGACQSLKKRRTDLWRRWKVINPDSNPCETN